MKQAKNAKKIAKKFVSNVSINEIPQAIDELSAIASLMENDKDFKNILVSPMFSDDEKKQVVSYISNKFNFSNKVIKYIDYIFQEKAMALLLQIVNNIIALHLNMQKKVKATVTLPLPISADIEEQIKSALKQITGKDIDLEFVIDSLLLGGILIKVGSVMYDNSIKCQLRLLRDKIIEG